MTSAELPVPAALWRRGLARALDYVAMFWWLFAMQVLGITFWVDSSATVFVTLAGFYAVLEIVYIALRGQTPAKEVLKIRVVRSEGSGPPGWRVTLVRWLLPGLAIALPSVLPWWTAFIALVVLGAPAMLDPQRRTIHDRLAGTVVVPYDAKRIEGPVRTRRQLVRNPMDRTLAAITGRPELMSDDED